jgi:hypothetical protein
MAYTVDLTGTVYPSSFERGGGSVVGYSLSGSTHGKI